MKTFTRVIAVVMMVAVLASLMAACGKSNYIDNNLVGTWKQTDETDGNWIWTFNNDGTCKLVGETTGFDSEGTYNILEEGNGKVKIKLDAWDAEENFTYTVTEKAMILESFDVSYYCEKQ